MRSFEERLKEIWQDEQKTAGVSGAFADALGLLSLPYGGAVAARNRLYDEGLLKQEKLPCPVISVGNLTVGGTGKTPTVIFMAHLLRDHGYRPAVLSRGYGGSANAPVNVVSGGNQILMGWREAGDEPILIARAAPGIPVLTGSRRLLTGRAAVETFGADVLILDDAFQHRSLFRDIDIVLLDAARPFGNGFLLPRGPLREPPDSLRRADILLRTGDAENVEPLWEAAPMPSEDRECPSTSSGRTDAGAVSKGLRTAWFDRLAMNGVPFVLSLSKDKLRANGCGSGIEGPSFRAIHKPQGLVTGGAKQVEAVTALQGKKVFAFAGIGFPEAFRRTLTGLGAAVVGFQVFPDHHPYDLSDIEALRRSAEKSGAAWIVTTEKDGIRLADFPDFLAALFLLRIAMEITPAGPFSELVSARLADRKGKDIG
ncbi:MAG: tetraacyldisaccharide 4'-kinase, partial [Deltaproteobacteria bacterium]